MTPAAVWPVAISHPEGVIRGLGVGPQTRPPDLVMLHANGFCASLYAPILARLAPDFTAVALDLRGHGRTELPTPLAGFHTWRGYAADMAFALQELVPKGARAPVLSGHSLGGMVSLLTTELSPASVERLVLFDPVVLNPKIHLMARLPLLRRLGKRTPLALGALKRRADFPSRAAVVESYAKRKAFANWAPGLLEAYVDQGFVDRPDGTVTLACRPEWEAATFGAQGQDTWGVLARCKRPVRLFAAEEGSTVYGGVERVARVAPKVVASTVAKGTHFFPLEQPDVIEAAWREVLAGR